MWRLAVDFGTSNTTAAVCPVGADDVTVLRLSDDADHMPSAVLASGDAEHTSTIYVGLAAHRQASLYPDCFLPDPKTHLGEADWDFGPFRVPIHDLVAAVLLRVLRKAREFVDGEISEVVLTHPADWESHRLKQLRIAAREAGLGDVELLPEPIAAAARYASAESTTGPVGVFDFGAGTCDVAVLERIGREFTVLAHAGEPLGGNHIDAALIQTVLDELGARSDSEAVALAERLRSEIRSSDMMMLRESVQQAKHHLSEYPHAPVRVSSSVVTLTADQLDGDAMPVVERAVSLLDRVLQSAGLDPSEIPALYLTGGSSRLRPVARQITELMQSPPHMRFDPKTVVVAGALHHIHARNAQETASTEAASEPAVRPRAASAAQVAAAQRPSEPYSIATDAAYASLFRPDITPPPGRLPLEDRRAVHSSPSPADAEVTEAIGAPRQQTAQVRAPRTAPARVTHSVPAATRSPGPNRGAAARKSINPVTILLVIVLLVCVAAAAAWLGRLGAIELLSIAPLLGLN